MRACTDDGFPEFAGPGSRRIDRPSCGPDTRLRGSRRLPPGRRRRGGHALRSCCRRDRVGTTPTTTAAASRPPESVARTQLVRVPVNVSLGPTGWCTSQGKLVPPARPFRRPLQEGERTVRNARARKCRPICCRPRALESPFVARARRLNRADHLQRHTNALLSSFAGEPPSPP